MVPGIKNAGAKRPLHRHGKNAKAGVPFAVTQIATQRLRLRFGKEEQGSGRMASFLSKDKKDVGAKRTLHRHGKCESMRSVCRHPNRNPAIAVAIWKGGARERADGVFFVQRQKRRRSKADFAPTWCERGDLNSHDCCHTHLKRACLPVPALSQLAYCFMRRLL